MATQVQRRRGTASEHNTFTGAAGEVTVNTTNDSLHVHDGATAGGIELSRADGQNANIPTTAMASGTILQVQQAVKTNTFTISSTTGSTFLDIPGLSVSITPRDVNSKFLINMFLTFGGDDIEDPFFRLHRNGSTPPDSVGDADGDRISALAGSEMPHSFIAYSHSPVFLDSPGLNTSIVYQVVMSATKDAPVHLNRTHRDDNRIDRGRYISTITVMEIAG